MSGESLETIGRKVSRLTFVVWVLVILIGINITEKAALWVLAAHGFINPPIAQVAADFAWNDFYKLPLDKKISKANAIVVTKYAENGSHVKCVVTEVLKKDPDVSIALNVGDEIPTCGIEKKAGEFTGEGAVVFFGGSPSELRYSVNSYAGHLAGENDIAIDALKKEVLSVTSTENGSRAK